MEHFFYKLLNLINLKGTHPIGPPGRMKRHLYSPKNLNQEELDMYNKYMEKYKQDNISTKIQRPVKYMNTIENMGFFDKKLGSISDEEYKKSLEEALNKVKPQEPSYLPIEGEEGLFYRMDIFSRDGDMEYRWKVTDIIDGSNCMYSTNAKFKSLKETIELFKKEFYGK